MVARGQGRVNRPRGVALATVVVLALAVPGHGEGKRRAEPEEFTEQGVLEPEAVDASLTTVHFELGPEEEAASLADLMDGHLGLGTAVDVFLEGPAGVRVNLLSGNLVWRGSFLPHGSPHDEMSMPLTYNAQAEPDPQEPGANGLPDRWRSGFQERLRPGPFGVMEIVEDDGFVHRFYAMREGQPMSREALIDEIVGRRREAGRTPGEAIPSGSRFRRRMEDDDAFMAAMRARFLGEGTGLAGRYVSEGRGHQVLEVEDDGAAVRRASGGGGDRFDRAGRLVARSRMSGASVQVQRGRSGIDQARIDAGPTLTIERDGGGRIQTLVGAGNRRVGVVQQHGQLTEIAAPEGRWQFEYEKGTGLLVSAQGPRDWVRVRYDGAARRVVALEGPEGEWRIDYAVGGQALGATVSSPRGDASVRFDTGTRERRVVQPTGSRRVRFDRGANRPLQIGELVLTYDTAGRVVRVEGPEGSLEVITGEDDRPTAIRTSAGDEVALAMNEDGLLAVATDGGGVEVRYTYDAFHRLDREEGAAGSIALDRGPWGQLERVAYRGGDGLRVDRDAAGRVERLVAPAGGEMILRWDEADRLRSARGLGDHELELQHADDGSMRIQDADGGVLTFSQASPSRLGGVERNSPPLHASLEGAPDGLVVGLSTRGGRQIRARHEGARLVTLSGGAGGDLQLEYDGLGLTAVEDGASRWLLERDGESGRPVRLRGAGGPDLRLAYDRSGRVISMARGARSPYRTTRDRGGRVDSVDPAFGRTLALHRDVRGRVVELVDGEDSTLRLRRDTRGRISAAAVGREEAWWLAALPGGWPHRVGAPDGRVWTLIGESAGRPSAAKWPDGASATFEWTASGALGAARWSGGAWYLLYGNDGRLARTEALLGGLVEYEDVGHAMRVWRGGRLHRRLELDAHGRYLRGVDGETGTTVDQVSRSAAGELASWRRPGGTLTVVHDSHQRPWQLTDDGEPTLDLSVGYGMDGLLVSWELGALSGTLDRGARGQVIQGSYPVLPSSSPVSPLFRPATHAPPSGALAHALLHPYLAPPWARGGGATAHAGAGREASLGPPLPRWAIDLLWTEADAGWVAALPEPPCAAVAVPDPRAAERVTVAGVLTLLGFLPDDLSEHRQLASLPASPVTVALPGAAELRALYHPDVADAGGLTDLSVEPGGRGLVLHPEPSPVGHPTPWAAVHDPLELIHPASELLGLATPVPAPGAADPRPRRFSDSDPLAERYRHAVDAGRWWSGESEPVVGRWVLGSRQVAGALGPWTASRIQVVVDGRGRIRGLDLGATAIDAWGRQVIEAFYGAALEGSRPSDLSRFAPVWIPLSGAPPEVALGLVPGAGRLWPDRTGTTRLSW